MPPNAHRSRTRAGSVLAPWSAAALLLPAIALAQAPDRIDLPAGWQPEGITTDGTSLFAGSLANGAIWKGDPSYWPGRRAGARRGGHGLGRP